MAVEKRVPWYGSPLYKFSQSGNREKHPLFWRLSSRRSSPIGPAYYRRLFGPPRQTLKKVLRGIHEAIWVLKAAMLGS